MCAHVCLQKLSSHLTSGLGVVQGTSEGGSDFDIPDQPKMRSGLVKLVCHETASGAASKSRARLNRG